MAGRRRRWLLFVILVMIGCAGLFCLPFLVPSERMLTDRATIVLPAAKNGCSNYQWLSNSELLLNRTAQSSAFDQVGLFHLVIAPGSLTPDPTPEGQPDHWSASLSAQYENPSNWLSPRGDWLIGMLIDTHSKTNPHIRYYSVGRVDGTRQIRIDADDGFMGTRWLADGRHWIEIYGKHVVPPRFRGLRMNMNSAPMQIRRICVRDIDTPAAVTSIAIPAASQLSQFANAQIATAVSQDRLLVWQQTPLRSSSQVVVRELDARSPQPIRQYNLTPPPGGVVQLVFTPGGDRILWKVAERRQANQFSRIVSSLLFRKHSIGTMRESLWVSRIDGSGMHEIGGVNNPDRELMIMSGPPDPETHERMWGPPVPHTLRWSPDGKRIGFAYKGAIWTVPAD